jgi:hypothetical protein
MARPAFELTRMRLPCLRLHSRCHANGYPLGHTLPAQAAALSFSRRKRTVTAGSSHEKETLAQWVPQKSTMAEKAISNRHPPDLTHTGL